MSQEPFRTVVADPGWSFGDKLPGPSRGAAKNYRVMSVEEICKLILPPVAPDARLFLWRVASMQEEALSVMRAWGFVLKSEMVWLKRYPKSGKLWFGMGRQVRMSHEVCLIGTRGRPERLNASTRSVFDAPYTRHSGKPEEFFDLVEALSPGPFLELFARRKRPGWTCLGEGLA